MSEDLVILGLDLSLTHTGWATIGEGKSETGSLKPKLKGVERLAWYEQQVKELVWFHKPVLAVIENYAFGASHKLAEIGELGGVARLVLKKAGIPYIQVAPTTLKKFVTNSGVAEKGAVMVAILQSFGVAISNNNEADAFGLAKFGEFYLGKQTAPKWRADIIHNFKKKESKS